MNRGRPKGDFEIYKKDLYLLIKSIAGLKSCNATNAYFATRLQKSVSQIQNYLKALETDGLIVIIVSSARFDRTSGKFYKTRSIFPKYNVEPLPAKVSKHPTDLKVLGYLKAVEHEESLKKQVEEEVFALETFDRTAVLKELQEELALQGVQMEI